MSQIDSLDKMDQFHETQIMNTGSGQKDNLTKSIAIKEIE
jgi:hypothetical protein